MAVTALIQTLARVRNMGLLRLVAPTTFPVDIDEVRLRLRIDDQEDDVGVQRLIAAATRAIENKTQRALITQKWEFTADAFPGANSFCDGVFLKKNSNIISLPLPPIQSVDAIKYIDSVGNEITLPLTDYCLDKSTFLASVYPAHGKAWPHARRQRQAVRIDFTTGYGGATDVEPDLVLAILLMIGHLDQNREAVSDRQMFELPMGVQSLIEPYIVPSAP